MRVYTGGAELAYCQPEVIVLRPRPETRPKGVISDRVIDEIIADDEAQRYIDRMDVGIDPEEI